MTCVALRASHRNRLNWGHFNWTQQQCAWISFERDRFPAITDLKDPWNSVSSQQHLRIACRERCVFMIWISAATQISLCDRAAFTSTPGASSEFFFFRIEKLPPLNLLIVKNSNFLLPYIILLSAICWIFPTYTSRVVSIIISLDLWKFP